MHVASDRFTQLWASHDVGAHVSDTKTIHHAQVGSITLDCDVFTVPGSDARIVVFTPPDNDATGRLALVRTIAHQQLDTHPHDEVHSWTRHLAERPM